MNGAEKFGEYTKWPEYTNWPGRKTFKEEKKMVREAIESNNQEVIRKYLKPLILYWARDFKTNQSKLKLTYEEYIKAGFMHLKFALRKYDKRMQEGKTGFKFSSYFEWFIRQGFLDYFKQKDVE